MRDEEVLAIMRMLCQIDPKQDAHSQPSSLGGSTGLAVDRFRRQCLGEYLDTLDQCRKKGVSVSQSSLEKGEPDNTDMQYTDKHETSKLRTNITNATDLKYQWLSATYLPKLLEYRAYDHRL